LIFAGWSSNSKYSLLGALRAIAQTISYEIPLIFFTFFVIILAKSFFLRGFVFSFSRFCLFRFSIYLFVVSFLCRLAETNRAPFDLAEGESELVSGFNVEYGGAKFALIFLAEYSNIIFFSFFFVLSFFQYDKFSCFDVFGCCFFIFSLFLPSYAI
jgi:NADH-ubiquinone oxidoreductase chain 1